MISSIVRSGSRVLPLLPIVLFACAGHAGAQTALGADAVETFTPGTGSGVSYGADYFPSNVLGLPDSAARPTVPSVDPQRVFALGLGGEIVLRFDRAPILDRPGADLAVYENAFRYTIGGVERVYAEPAEVSVSSDGVAWRVFPFDSLSLAGCAGVTPTDGRYPPSDPLSGGDRFDLAALGADTVRYVRLRDVTWMVKSNASHPFYDFTLNGFDLDAVVNISAATAPAEVAAPTATDFSLAPSVSNGSSTLRLALPEPERIRCTLLDPRGGAVVELFNRDFAAGEHRVPVDAGRSGSWLLRIERMGRAPITLRWIVVR